MPEDAAVFQAVVCTGDDENCFALAQKEEREITYAGIFNVNLTPGGYNVLLNKGSRDGISEGDIVVSAGNVLIGRVQKVMDNFSRVLFVYDPAFKITGKILGSDVAGIARGALRDGMYLDLIVQADEIKEGDTLISAGDDMFPPALVIGQVDHVELNETQLFKKVRIKPAIQDGQIGKVIVIKTKR